MPETFHGTDVSGVIPSEFSAQEATQQSAALTLGSTVPMGTRISHMPVLRAFPQAAFVSASGGRKPFTTLKIGEQQLVAEEGDHRRRGDPGRVDRGRVDPAVELGAAPPGRGHAVAFDFAVFFGTEAPASYPAGGKVANATAVVAGPDAVETVNAARRRGRPARPVPAPAAQAPGRPAAAGPAGR